MKLEEINVSLVIPSYNTRDLLETNMGSVIEAKDYVPNKILEIIVVDDGSTDDTSGLIKNRFPGVRLIQHKVNRGFAAAVNTGARMAKGNLVCLLNTDVIPDKDFLIEVFPDFEDNEVFGVSLHERGYGWAKGFLRDGFVGHESGAENSSPHTTFWVSGGSGIFRRDYWMELGGMDEKVFSPFYWEDLDLSYRAMKKGLKILWEPNSYVTHKHESTINRLSPKYVSRIKERNQLLFNWKNITSPNFTAKHFAGLAKRIIAHPGYIRVLMMALSKLPQVIRARRKVIKESKVSDEAIFARFK